MVKTVANADRVWLKCSKYQQGRGEHFPSDVLKRQFKSSNIYSTSKECTVLLLRFTFSQQRGKSNQYYLLTEITSLDRKCTWKREAFMRVCCISAGTLQSVVGSLPIKGRGHPISQGITMSQQKELYFSLILTLEKVKVHSSTLLDWQQPLLPNTGNPTHLGICPVFPSPLIHISPLWVFLLFLHQAHVWPKLGTQLLSTGSSNSSFRQLVAFLPVLSLQQVYEIGEAETWLLAPNNNTRPSGNPVWNLQHTG